MAIQVNLHFDEDEGWIYVVHGEKGRIGHTLEDEDIIHIKGMILEYNDGLFYGVISNDMNLIRTGISFTGAELIQILHCNELQPIVKDDEL